MLVTITIMLLILGGGLTSYLQFDARQRVLTAADQIEVALRTAQKRARVGDKPTGCETLQGYTVQLQAGSGNLMLLANCDVAGAPEDFPVETQLLRGSTTAVSSVNVQFNVLAGGVAGAEAIQIQSGDLRYEVEVTSGGEILNNGFVTN
jgi:type II secretory pathway pseudopilin PulG